jgi:hypothetical protein
MAEYDVRGLSQWFVGERVSMGRRVDLDLIEMDWDTRVELEADVDRLKLIQDANLPQPLPLGRGKFKPAKDKHVVLLGKLQELAGAAFDDGDEWMRSVYILAWHRVLARLDLWPYQGNDIWRLFILKTSDAMSWDDPYTNPYELPYGRWVYDSFESLFELERYYLCAWLRISQWIQVCHHIRRFDVIEPITKTAVKESRRSGGLIAPEVQRGRKGVSAKAVEGKMNVALFERLQDIEQWTQTKTHIGDRWSYLDGPGAAWAEWRESSSRRYEIAKRLCSFSELRVRINERPMIAEAARRLVDRPGITRRERSISNGLISTISTQTQRLEVYMADLFILASVERKWEAQWLGIQ